MPHLIQTAITLLAAATGGSVGVAIITISIALRIALLPLTIRIARRAEEQRIKLEALQPELARIKTQFRKNPERLATETLALYKAHGVQPFDARSITMLLLQLPIVSALYRAIGVVAAGQRFLWIANLAKPDFLLVAITGLLTFGVSNDMPRSAALISTAITVAILWRLSAAIGLYWASSTAIGAVQAMWMRRRR